MKVLVRKTLTGSEYWDSEAKRILFVPVGEEHDFKAEVLNVVVEGIDLASGKDMTVVNDQAEMIGQQTQETTNDIADSFKRIVDGINLEDLNAEQLLSLAKQIDINVPGNMKKEETIRKFIEAALKDATDKG